MNKSTRRWAVLSASLVAVAMTMAPVAHAGTPDTTIDVEVGTPTSLPTERWVDDDGYERWPLAELEALAETQTAEEIASVLTSGEPYNDLVDGETGEVRAAVLAERVALPRSMMSVAGACSVPGHATASQLIGGKGRPTCYNGTGWITVGLPNVYYVAAGNKTTLWTYNSGSQYVTGSGTSHTFSPVVNMGFLVR